VTLTIAQKVMLVVKFDVEKFNGKTTLNFQLFHQTPSRFLK